MLVEKWGKTAAGDLVLEVSRINFLVIAGRFDVAVYWQPRNWCLWWKHMDNRFIWRLRCGPARVTWVKNRDKGVLAL